MDTPAALGGLSRSNLPAPAPLPSGPKNKGQGETPGAATKPLSGQNLHVEQADSGAGDAAQPRKMFEGELVVRKGGDSLGLSPPPGQAVEAAPPPAAQPAPAAQSQRATAPDAAAPLPQQIERLIESFAQARETGRSARGEVRLRHVDFGTITIQVEGGQGDVRAVLASRDPGGRMLPGAAMRWRGRPGLL